MTTATETALQQHPLSAAFPSMPENELAALALDIGEHGQREPGVLFEGMVLDGWHRYLACKQAGVEFKAMEFDGADPVAFVISKNLHRRHLSAMQKAAAVLSATSWRKRGSATVADPSADELAEKADVSPRTIAHAKTAHEMGLGDEAREGKVTAREVEAVSKLPKAKREKAVQAIKDGEEPALPKPKVIKADPKFERLYEEVKQTLEETLEKNAELADVARELNEKLEAFEATEPDEQQKLIASLQLTVRKKDAEIDRLRVQIRDADNKNNALIREVKKLQRRAGVGQ